MKLKYNIIITNSIFIVNIVYIINIYENNKPLINLFIKIKKKRYNNIFNILLINYISIIII